MIAKFKRAMNGARRRAGFLVVVSVIVSAKSFAGLGLPQDIVVEAKGPQNAFPVVSENRVAELWYDANDWPGVVRAIADLQLDVERVTERKPHIATTKTSCKRPIIIGDAGMQFAD